MGMLIAGLGNPGTKYERTRHNMGFEVVLAFAKRRGWSWKKNVRLNGWTAEGSYEGEKVILLMPATYMNLSGEAVSKAVDYYKLKLDESMVVTDEVYLHFGRARIRPKGSAGGHNGLFDIEQALKTQEYPRLRMGVGNEAEMRGPLEAFVLSRFTKSEIDKLPHFVDQGAELLECWLQQGIEKAMQMAGEIKG